jgi:hypothetical protein
MGKTNTPWLVYHSLLCNLALAATLIEATPLIARENTPPK